MNRIEEYVNSLYSHIDSDNKEVIELKDEMKTHLVETVNEQKSLGKSEEESIQIALERFGDKKLLTMGLFDIFKSQKRFAKMALLISFITLFFGLVSGWAIVTWDDTNTSSPQVELDPKIMSIVDKDASLSAEKNAQLDLLINKYIEDNKDNKHVQVQSITIYLSEDKNPGGIGIDRYYYDSKSALSFDSTKAKYRYLTTKSLDKFINLYTIARQNEKWFVVMEYRKPLVLLYIIPIGLLVASVVLFGVWLVQLITWRIRIYSFYNKR